MKENTHLLLSHFLNQKFKREGSRQPQEKKKQIKKNALNNFFFKYLG